MNTQNILTANILDIVFDGRNKSYGAYELRKNYNKRLVKALAGMMGICLMLTMGSILANGKKMKNDLVLGPEIELKKFVEKVDKVKPPQEEPKPQPQKQFEQVAVNIPVIAPDDQVDEKNEIKPVEATEDIKIGASSFDGEKGGENIAGAPPVENSVTGSGDGKLKTDNTDYNTIFTTVEIAAQFPGGFDAWKKYLERNLNAGLPAENGAQAGKYTVMVSFVIDKDGNISDVKAENAPGFGTEAEAIKIIKKGPKWQPAIQNGKKVAYRARQQVTFLVDDNE